MVLKPTIRDIESAVAYFSEKEPSEWHYKAMLSLINPPISKLPQNIEPDSVDELAVYLMFVVSSWNVNAYRSPSYNAIEHYQSIRQPLRVYWLTLMDYRTRSIRTFNQDDVNTTIAVFDGFRSILGPVGTAKALHLIAPEFLPAWDKAIRNGYGLSGNSRGYIHFIQIIKEQIDTLEAQGFKFQKNPIKLIDQFNFWHFTRGRGEAKG